MVKSKEEVVQEFRIQSIQDATMRVIARKGMSAATMQEIAHEAGVAKGTIYLYFRDRDELVERTFESAIAEMHRRIDESLERDLAFEEKLREIVRAHLAFFGEHAEFFRLYISLRVAEGNPQQQRRHKRNCQPQYDTRVKKFADFLGGGMERGEIRRMDPLRLALFLIEGITAITFERLSEASSPDEGSDVDLIVGLALDGIRKQKRGTH